MLKIPKHNLLEWGEGRCIKYYYAFPKIIRNKIIIVSFINILLVSYRKALSTKVYWYPGTILAKIEEVEGSFLSSFNFLDIISLHV